MLTNAIRTLVIEDVDLKYADVRSVMEEDNQSVYDVVRVKTVVEAQDALEKDSWDLVIVDISMDIAPSNVRTREAHANMGGMDLIEQMYLLERECKTVIVTGFDYFVREDRDNQEAQTFSELECQARQWLGPKLLGCVRYGVPGWQHAFADALERRLSL